MTSWSRRDLLGVVAKGAAAATLLDGCQKSPASDPYLRSQIKPPVPGSDVPRGTEEQIASVCGQCPAGCGISVRVVEGRAVKVEGLPQYPVNEGSLGPKGQSGVEVLYHRDRFKGPMRREGPKGAGRLVPTTWDEAIAAVGAALKAVRDRGEARSVVVIDGQPRGPTHELFARFATAFGTPNLVNHRSTTDGAKGLASLYMTGVNELPAYDWPRTHYVLGLGPALLESWCQTIHMVRAQSSLRHGVPGRRVKLVAVSPRYSATAAKADEWIAVRPGTYGAFALGLCHVLVRDKLYDAQFVAEQTFGFEDFTGQDGKPHRGFKSVVMEQGAPAAVAAATGVPVDVLERIAHELHELGPSVAVSDGTVGSSSNGLFTAMSVHALNALLGNIGRPGGMLVQPSAPLAPWKTLELDAVAREGLGAPRLDGAGTAARPLADGAVHALPAALLAAKPYAASAVLLHYSNPAFSKPGPQLWLKALAQVPLVVSFSPFPDEGALLADWVLPDSTYLERWEMVEPSPSLGREVLGLRRPAVLPLYDTRSSADVLISVAKAIGGSVGSAFPWEGSRQASLERLSGLVGRAGASIEGEDPQGIMDAMAEGGGWWMKASEPKARQAFATPSGKLELFSQLAQKRLAQAAPSAPPNDLMCLPHYEPPKEWGDAKEYPYMIVAYRGMNYAEGGVRHQRRLVSLPVTREFGWRERIELAPPDAEALGVVTGNMVEVETPAGSRTLTAVIRTEVQPGVVGLPLGYGQWPPRPGEVTGVYGLLEPTAEDPVSGVYAMSGTRARVRRVS